MLFKATKDDILPLSAPLMTRSGTKVDHVVVSKGSTVTIPIRCMNRSTSIWGPNAKEFVPERWVDEAGITEKAREIQGFSHLLTFADGSRTCLGKGFVLAEFKVCLNVKFLPWYDRLSSSLIYQAVLSVLIRNYRFALRDGPDTRIELHRSMLRRPKVVGEDGAVVPLRVTRA